MKQLSLNADVDFIAAGDELEGEMPIKLSIEAYTGSPIRQSWSKEPIVIDLSGLQSKSQIPVVIGHDYSLDSILGQTSSVRVEGSKLLVECEVMASSEKAKQVVALAKRGYRWQASVGADVVKHSRVAADATVTVNGSIFEGPIRVVKASDLREVSIVTLGADAETTVAIAAEIEEPEMSSADTAVVAENDFPVETVTATESVGDGREVIVAANPELDALREEVSQMKALIAARDNRGPAIHASAGPAVCSERVDEAALCIQAGLANPERHFDARTMEAADRASRSTSLGEVLVKAARTNGYDGGSRLTNQNIGAVLRAAFATHSITDILSNTANKFLLSGFTAVEQVWQEVSSVRSVNDFKTISMFRLNGSFKFAKVGNGGTLQMAEASDEKRTVSADTYGIMTNVSRQDLINDDLNALSAVNSRIGRGAALSMNDVIWGEFQSGNADYYAAATPGSGNAMSLSALKIATTAFRKLKDPDGNPLGIAPKILVVPPDLELAAVELMTSSLLITGADTTRPAVNVMSGRYKVVVSSNLTSASTWWLAADPRDLNSLDVVFLNGQQSPTIEQVAMDSATMGITLRGYMDFGVAKAESNACYRMATA